MAIVINTAIIRLSFVIKDPISPPSDTVPSKVNNLKPESIPGLKVESIDMDATAAKSNEIQITMLRDWIKAFDLYKVPMKTDIHIIAGTNPKLNCNNISSRTVIYAFVNSVPNINPTIATIATIAKMQATI